MKYLLILGMLVLSLSSFAKVEAFDADSKGGGGGDAYVCFEDSNIADQVDSLLKKKINPFDDETIEKIKSIRLLDLEEIPEGKEHLFSDIDLTQGEKSVRAVKKKVYERLNLLLPTYAEILKNHSDLRYIPNRALPEINDENIKFSREPHCVFVQMAIQDIGTGDVNYFKKLYDILPAVDVAALDFHEKFLRNHFNNGAENSYYVRKLVGYLFSNKFHREFGYYEWNALDGLADSANEEFQRYPVFKTFMTKHKLFDNGEYFQTIIQSIEPKYNGAYEHYYFMRPDELLLTGSGNTKLLFDPINIKFSTQIEWNFDVETEAQGHHDIDIENLTFTFYNRRVDNNPSHSIKRGLRKEFHDRTFYLHNVDYNISEQPNKISDIVKLEGSYIKYADCTIGVRSPSLIEELSEITQGAIVCSENTLLPESINYSFASEIQNGKISLKESSLRLFMKTDAESIGTITELHKNGVPKEF
ncbi:hypothetical protein N9N67_12625, partial [Bacteriovoracaceae bacterium]|nr:hypothetical protein [Bacteriovoracaceae bacterium]